MDVTLFVLRIVPLTIEFLNPEFGTRGYDSRQLADTVFRKKMWEQGSAFIRDSFENSRSILSGTQGLAAASGLKENETEADDGSADVLSEEDRFGAEADAGAGETFGADPAPDTDSVVLFANGSEETSPTEPADDSSETDADFVDSEGEPEEKVSRRTYSAFDFGGELLDEEEESEKEDSAEAEEEEPDGEEDDFDYEAEEEPVSEGLAAESRNMAEEVRRMMELRSTEEPPAEEEEEKVPDEEELEEYRDLFGGVEDLHRGGEKKTPLIEREGRVDLREYLDEMDIDEEDPEEEEDYECSKL